MQELSDTQRKEIAALAAQRDEDIDYSDITPIRNIPLDAVRGRFYRGPAVYLNSEVLAYFSEAAMRRGVSINELVNNVLSKELAIFEALK
jgi:hypothetical protein